jgi:isopenicillin N synthase-like dioxygenase
MNHFDYQGKSIYLKTPEGDILGIHATGHFDDQGNWYEMEAWLNQYDSAETFQGSLARLQTPIEESVQDFLKDGCTILRREDPKFEYTPYIHGVYLNMETDPKQLVESLRETGFLIVGNHGIPQAMFDAFYTEWKNFFDQEEALKNFFKFSANNQSGYYPVGSEKAKDAKIPDLKEFYHYYPDRSADPTNGITLYLQTKLNELGVRLLSLIQEGLPDDVKAKLKMPLPEMIINSKQTLFRILHYPAMLENEVQEGAVRAAAHEDINLITLLPMASTEGLQVLHKSGKWIEAGTDPHSILINVGDMLEEATGGYLKSTTHRVVNTNMTYARYSAPLFIHPRPDVRLSDRYTAAEHLDERLKALGLK